MTFNDFFKNKDGHIFLIISVYDEFYVEVYKTQNIKIQENFIEIESEKRYERIDYWQCTKIDETSIYTELHNDGHVYKIGLFDCDSCESLKKAYDKLNDISKKLENFKKIIDDKNNLIYYEYLDKLYKNNVH